MNQKIYSETHQACMAGGMTSDEAHEYATDRASRAPAVAFTPGDWRHQGTAIYGEIKDPAGNGRTVTIQIAHALRVYSVPGMDEANARLIAQSPAMLEALARCREIAQDGSMPPSARLKLIRDTVSPVINAATTAKP